ncbi:DExH-box ATP-dependent RNA helicase DExH18 mitochondrial [Bienertia sinuspersici]
MRKICSDTRDELVEQHYERFKPLVVESKTLLGDLRNVKSGDCVVAFSRREMFKVKLAIEKQTNDAVGMGLNLNIRSVVFYNLSKYNWDKVVQVSASQQLKLFARQLPNMTFAQLLAKFSKSRHLDGSYYLCQQAGINKVANMLENVPGLSLEDRYNFFFAPVNLRDPKAMYHLLRFASSFSQKLPVNIAMGIPTGSARNDSELLDLETNH